MEKCRVRNDEGLQQGSRDVRRRQNPGTWMRKNMQMI